MKKIIYIMTFLILMSCKSTQIEFDLPKTNTITEYYESGQIKRVGNIDDSFKEFYNLRIGLWNEFYENGKLKSSGNYKLDTYEDCCTGGVCDGYYSFKIGEWIYFHENGELKAKGIYKIGKVHKETSCEGGDEINFGYITKDWKFYDLNGNQIEPTKKDIHEIEKSSVIDDWNMEKK